MQLDFYTSRTGSFSLNIPEDDNLYLVSESAHPTKEVLEQNVLSFYRLAGCQLGSTRIKDVSIEEATIRLKETIDKEGEDKALYNIYLYAETLKATDIALYGLEFDYSYLLDKNKEIEDEVER